MSSPAKAGDPAFQSAGDWRTGYSAFARYDDHRQFAGLEREAFFVAAFSFPPPFPSASSASRTCLNSCSDAFSVRGNRKFSVSSVLTIADPITPPANHLGSAGTTYHGATAVDV